MTTISLITATYNSGKTIADTLRSVAEQTYPDIEHLILDGASRDNTLEIVAKLGMRVASVVSERDNGIYDVWNKGITKASGEIIGFINSDDFYASTTVITEVMAAFAADPELEAVHADLIYVDQDDTAKIVRHWKSRDCTEKSIRRGFIPAHPTVFLRRSVYEKAGSFDLDFRLAADYEFLLRIFHTYKIKARYIPRIWVRMRVGGATGGTVASIKLQNDEIRRGQAKHGISYPTAKFYVHKVIDRTMQRLRARFVKMPT